METIKSWYFWVGIIAAICIAIYMMPQLVKVIKTKDTSSISVAMFIIALVGNLFFVLDGIGMLIDNKGVAASLPIILANGVAFVISFIIAFYKFRNMKWAKKHGVNEAEIAKNYNKYLKEYKEEKAKKKLEKATQVLADAKKEEAPKDSSTIG